MGQGETAMGLTLRQAADLCGRSRSTIHRALKSGKLSGGRDDDGSWSIDPSELARVFPWDTTGQAQRDTEGHPDTGQKSPSNEETAVLRMKVAMLEQQLEREQGTVEDLRRRLDKAEERAYLLSAPQQDKKPITQQENLWGRLLQLIKGPQS